MSALRLPLRGTFSENRRSIGGDARSSDLFVSHPNIPLFTEYP
jgi:hypothetical protein